MTRSIHFGPSRAHVGGMASVIDALVRHRIGADEVEGMTTYVPGSHPRSAVATARAIGVVARSERARIVHVHMSEGGSFVREGAVVLAARARGCTVAITIHGPGFAEFAERHAKLVRRILSAADVVTVLSDVDLEAVRSVAPQVRVAIMPNPTPVDPASPPADQTEEIVLFAGEIGHRKGADVLERAWPRVARDRPEARLIMVGPLVLDHAPAGERLEVRDPVPIEAVRELLHAVRVVVLPSRGEALPMILTEAMAARRPFVSTPTGGTPSLAPGGILVPVEDEDALAGALVELLADPRRAGELGQAGQELCRATRGAEAIDARLRALYSPNGGGA